MKIEEIHFSRMRNDEHFQFMTEFKNAVAKYGGATGLRIQFYYNSFLNLYAQEDEAFKKIVKSAITEEIQTADQYRDRIFRGTADTVKTALNHFSEDVLAAAKRLKVLFDTYGNLAQKPLNEETSAIYNLIQDLNGQYRADVSKINLAEWVNELQNANKKVSQLMENRYEESAAKTDLVLKKVRLQIDAVYRNIIERTNAFAIISDADETDIFLEFMRYFNTVIDKYRLIIAQRYGRKKNEQ